MSMFCSKCGSVVNDGERFCSVCGTPADAPSYQPPTSYEQTPAQPSYPAPSYSAPPVTAEMNANYGAPKKSKKGLIIGICAGVGVIAVAVVLLFLFVFKSGPEKAISKVFNDIKNEKYDSYIDSSYYYQFVSDASADDMKELRKELRENMEKTKDIQLKVYGVTDYSKDEIDALKKEFKNEGARKTDDIEDIKLVMMKTNSTYDGKKNVSFQNMVVVKVDGKWYFIS